MLVVGIAGGSGSGKSTVVDRIVSRLPANSVTLVPQDAYYKDNGHLSAADKLRINFDHPDAIEFPLLISHLDILKRGKPVSMPVYDYVTCARSEETVLTKPSSIIIVEGILILTHEELRKRFDIKIFVDADADERLMRISRRDISERGRDFNQVLRHYETFVKPMHLQFIEPSKRYADLIIPEGGNNHVAIDILTSRIRMTLNP